MCVKNATTLPFSVRYVAAPFVAHARGVLYVDMVSAIIRSDCYVMLVPSDQFSSFDFHLFLLGGHVDHMMQWFKRQEVCPTGCGCTCKLG